MPVEFNCAHCGSHVTRYWMFGEPDLCLICRFIQQADPGERHQLRIDLYAPEQFDYFNQVGSYRDETCEAAICQHCGKEYRGPAIYCCQRCALADAA